MVGPHCAHGGIYPQSSWEPLKGFKPSVPVEELVWLHAEHRRGQIKRRHDLERLAEREKWVNTSRVGGEIARTPWSTG